MRVFLTGGTGFIGQPLTKALLARGWNVVALVRSLDNTQANKLGKIGVQLHVGDITNRESMRIGMANSDIVIHNAGYYEYGINGDNRERMQNINVRGTENVLSLAYELEIPRTVYVSTVQAIGETGLQERNETFVRQSPCLTAYEQSKTDAHKIALDFQKKGLPLVIVCPGAVIGGNDHSAWGYFQRLYINHIMPPMGWSPNTISSPVYIDDLVEGIALAAEKGRIREMYFLCGEQKSFREFIDYWREKPGAYKPLIWLPRGLAVLMFAPLEPLQRMIGLPAFISRETVKAASTNTNYTSEKAKRELGWVFRSAEEMWTDTFDHEFKLLSKRKTKNLMKRLKPAMQDD
jgi:dihydroflavonol-4-reductase